MRYQSEHLYDQYQRSLGPPLPTQHTHIDTHFSRQFVGKLPWNPGKCLHEHFSFRPKFDWSLRVLVWLLRTRMMLCIWLVTFGHVWLTNLVAALGVSLTLSQTGVWKKKAFLNQISMWRTYSMTNVACRNYLPFYCIKIDFWEWFFLKFYRLSGRQNITLLYLVLNLL